MFLKNEWLRENNRLITAWDCITHLMTTLIQNFIPLKKFTLVINVISLVPSSRKLGSFDVFLHEQILQKEALF